MNIDELAKRLYEIDIANAELATAWSHLQERIKDGYRKLAQASRAYFIANHDDLKPKRPTHVVNGVTVPAPLTWGERHLYMSEVDTETKPVAFAICTDGIVRSSLWHEGEKFAFLKGVYFACELDAKANRDAIMKGAEA